jgi:cysteine-rich repeat protein
MRAWSVLWWGLVGCSEVTEHADVVLGRPEAALPADRLGPPAPFIIDSNNAANNTASYYIETSASWTSSTNVAGYHNTGYWVAPAAAIYDPATFWFYLDADACMVVESWWTSAGDRATNTPYQSYDASGANVGVVYANQRLNGSRWNEIGRYVFTAGWNRVLVSRWATLGTYVVADAVKLSPADNCPGWCGVDADGDGVGSCLDTCDNDPLKTEPGACGCGVPDTNQDGDAWADCVETCDTDPAKSEPGLCGCGVSDADADGDGLLACQESGPDDPLKTAPGVCGCGVADTDADGDRSLDCQETCDTDPRKLEPGICGCGVRDADPDGDGTPSCIESCDRDPYKLDPGVCGCGLLDADPDGDGVFDCTDCGDLLVDPPETCDDGNRTPGDGCDATCQVEALTVAVSPAAAGVRNAFVATSAQPGETITFVASNRMGITPVPGCRGVYVPLSQPVVIGTAVADLSGVATLDLRVPAVLAGRTVAILAVEGSSCRASDAIFDTF